MNNDMWDLVDASPWLQRRVREVRRVPPALTGLWCRATRAGGLMFAWHKPTAGALVEGYRLERTRDGRAYEAIGETERESCVMPPVAFDDGWFYRVSAFNARGQGPARWAYFYLRRPGNGSVLRLIPVRDGLRVNLCELACE